MKSRREELLERKRELEAQEKAHIESGKGWAGVGRDIKEGAKEAYPALKDMIKNLGPEAFGAGRQLLMDPSRFGKNIAGGGLQGLHGLASTPGNIRDYLVSKGIADENTSSFRLPESLIPKEFNANQAMGIQGHERGDAILQGLASAAPYIAGGELGAFGGAARVLSRSAAQMAHSVGQNENPVTAGLMVPGMEVPIRAAGAGFNALRPRHSLRGNIPIEELQANMRAAGDTETQLGAVVGSPTLKQIFENMSTKWPGSGSDALLARQGRQVENRAQGLLDESAEGLAPGERNAQLKTALEDAYETQRQRKNELYEPVNELAEAEGFTLDLPTFRQRANEHTQRIEDSPLMQYDTDFRNSYNKLARLSYGAEGGPSIAEANMTASNLHAEGTKLVNGNGSAKDRAIGRLYLDLAARARADVRNELRQRGSDDLNQAYGEATENYAENFSQFLDKDIYKLAQPGVEAETIINDIIKPGKQGDKFLRIEKIQNALPENQRNIIGNAWLRNAIDKEGTLSAKQFAQMIDKLGERQFEALFPDAAYRQRLLDYGNLRGMNEKALSRMANPNTGQQLAVPGMIGAQIAGVAKAAGQGNFLEAIGYALGPQVGSRVVNHLLTDPAIRGRVVEALQQPPRQNPVQLRPPISGALTGQADKQPWFDNGETQIYD